MPSKRTSGASTARSGSTTARSGSTTARSGSTTARSGPSTARSGSTTARSDLTAPSNMEMAHDPSKIEVQPDGATLYSMRFDASDGDDCCVNPVDKAIDDAVIPPPIAACGVTGEEWLAVLEELLVFQGKSWFKRCGVSWCEGACFLTCCCCGLCGPLYLLGVWEREGVRNVMVNRVNTIVQHRNMHAAIQEGSGVRGGGRALLFVAGPFTPRSRKDKVTNEV